jgi:uncharacterized membrane protein YoaK (UPF0700 family)
VFANAQTGNVIFLAIGLGEGRWVHALSYLWPILAFVAGVALSSHIKSGRLDAPLGYPLRWAMVLQVVVLMIIGFVPASVPHSFATVPISFVAALQMGLFRNVGELTYVAVATTGNLMRLVQFGYTRFVDKDPGSRDGFRIYAILVSNFVGGAVIGAIVTHAAGIRAAWCAAAMVAATLVLFVADDRRAHRNGSTSSAP